MLVDVSKYSSFILFKVRNGPCAHHLLEISWGRYQASGLDAEVTMWRKAMCGAGQSIVEASVHL